MKPSFHPAHFLYIVPTALVFSPVGWIAGAKVFSLTAHQSLKLAAALLCGAGIALVLAGLVDRLSERPVTHHNK